MGAVDGGGGPPAEEKRGIEPIAAGMGMGAEPTEANVEGPALTRENGHYVNTLAI